MPKTPTPFVRFAALCCVAIAGCRTAVPAPAPLPAPVARPSARYFTGQQVIGAMRDRYATKWYSTLTFKQRTSRLLPSGTWNTQTWYEAIHTPGRLRIDFDPISGGNGVMYARDSQFVATNGRIVRAEPGINDLLLLGFDVYTNPPARTEALLRRQGYDLTRVHEATVDGRPVVVVGASPGDTHRKQFWVDAERLYFVRLLEPDPRDTTKTQDIRFVNYERHGEAWLSPRVEIHTAGVLTFHEDYSDIQTDVPLDEALFDPKQWRTAKHWIP